MPRLMTSVMAWPVKPFHSPLRTDSVKPLIWCRTRFTSGITYQHQTQSITVKYVHIRHHLPIPGITYQHRPHSITVKYGSCWHGDHGSTFETQLSSCEIKFLNWEKVFWRITISSVMIYQEKPRHQVSELPDKCTCLPAWHDLSLPQAKVNVLLLVTALVTDCCWMTTDDRA